MSFLEKIEHLINLLLIKIGEQLWKAVPGPVKGFISHFQQHVDSFVSFFKRLPANLKTLLINFVMWIKTSALSFDYKAALVESYKKAMVQYKEKSGKGLSTAKTVLLTPYLVMGQWLEGLNASQVVLLLTFSAGSLLATIGIFFSGQRLMHEKEVSRFPASEEVAYERPEYYKKETKHFELVNFRLPIYFPKVNEIKSVDIDFIATLSNRSSRMYLERHEFQLRDFIILQMEPVVASFPLEAEGKEIIRRKLVMEINEFLKDNKIEGEVVELKITYELAN